MKVLLSWVLKVWQTDSTFQSQLHPALHEDDGNDLKRIFFPAMAFVFITMP